MSNIRQFPSKYDENVKKREAQRRRKNQIRLYIIIAVILLTTIAALLCYTYYKTKKYESYVKLSSVERAASGNAVTTSFDNSIMTYSKDGAEAISAEGKLLWNQTFDMQYPLMSKCNDTVAFADYGGSKIYIQTSSGVSSTVSTNMPIRKIAVSSGGYVVAVLEDINVTWIYMYDFNGKEISYFRTTMEKSGYPVDVDISPSGELVAVSYYYLDVDDVKSSVAFYNFGGVGQNNIDNCVSGYNYKQEFVPLVRFMNNSRAFSVSAERLSLYKDDHKPTSEANVFVSDEISSVFYGENVVALILRNPSVENKYRMELYNVSGELFLTKEFDFDYIEATFANDQVILYGDTSIYIATFSGVTKYEGTYEEPISLILPTKSNTRLAIVTERTIDTIELE